MNDITDADVTDLTWRKRYASIRDEVLKPSKLLEADQSRARSTVSTVTVVATLLGSLGILGATQLTSRWWVVFGASLATALATLAAGFSLSALTGVYRRFPTQDLAEVARWYTRSRTRARMATIGVWLLLLAVAVAGLTAVVGLADSRIGDPNGPLSLTTAGTGENIKLYAQATIHRVPADAIVEVKITGSSGSPTLMAGTLQPNAAGDVVLDNTIEKVGVGRFTMTVTVKQGEDTLKELELTTPD